MSIGYACTTIGVPYTDLRSCILRNACEIKLNELIDCNINTLNNIIDYNIDNNIKLFRISSDIIPFGSSPANQLKWWELYKDKLRLLGKKIKDNNIRVSMHPGQYTILNSTSSDVIDRAIEDLIYHYRFLECLDTDNTSKIVIHIGGVYGDKQLSMDRFCNVFKDLDKSIKDRIIIENDDKFYNVKDVLNISDKLNIPVVYDNLHNAINPYDMTLNDSYWIEECSKTWKATDGMQKMHYSEQDTLRRLGSHARSINTDKFLAFYEIVKDRDIDIMLEVKDKNLSAVKCINLTSNYSINNLEKEWARYKYKILEKSHQDYLKIRQLLKDKSLYPAKELYSIIDNALKKDITINSSLNAINHVKGYFKSVANTKEIQYLDKLIGNYLENKVSLIAVKNHLLRLSYKYNIDYLIKSYYFYL